MTPRDEFLQHWRNPREFSGVDENLFVQPFPGLRSFWQTESDLFFGRERQVQDLLKSLACRKVTFVLGGSGSGKSSLVRAGVMPRLTSAPIRPHAGAWYPVEFRPGEAPSSQLFEAILSQIIEPVLALAPDSDAKLIEHRYAALQEALDVALEGADLDIARRVCRDRLRDLLYPHDTIDIDTIITFASESLAILDKSLSKGAQAAPPNLFLLVDQFEEVFENKVRHDDRQMLISLIKEIHKRSPDRLYLMVTMRSEELHRCSEFQGLSEVINASLYLVDLLWETDLVSAIVGPVKRLLKAWDLEFDEPLTPEAIAVLQQAYRDSANTASSADRLPLIQHLLALVWNRAIQRWSEDLKSNRLLIDVTDVQAIEGWGDIDGVLQGCLSNHADRVLKEAITAARLATGSARLDYNEAEKLLIAAFCKLMRRDDRGNPKRAFATLYDMLGDSGVAEREGNSAVALRAGLERFMSNNLIGVIFEGRQEKYNVNHEAFIRGWKKYGKWLALARRCQDGLIEVDERLQRAKPVQRQSWSEAITEWVSAKRLEAANDIVTDDIAKSLEDVLGPKSTFSRAWACDALARNDAIEAKLMERAS
jgi:hypothetical protein